MALPGDTTVRTMLGVMAVLACAVCASCSLGDSEPAERRAKRGVPATSTVVGCRQRVESGRKTARPGRDTVIGPVGLYRLPSAYRSQARRPPASGGGAEEAFGLHVKAIALVRAGTRVELVVPRSQRGWLQLDYRPPHGQGAHAVVLQACRASRSPAARRRECGPAPRGACRGPTTQFGGGFEIAFDEAPRRGLCAELVVRVEGRERPLRRRLFRPPPRRCRGPA